VPFLRPFPICIFCAITVSYAYFSDHRGRQYSTTPRFDEVVYHTEIERGINISFEEHGPKTEFVVANRSFDFCDIDIIRNNKWEFTAKMTDFERDQCTYY
jgi:hypothetical protein